MLDDISADYVAGVLDIRSQARFSLDIPNSIDKSPTVGWSIRISLGDNEPLAGLLEEYFHNCGVHITFHKSSNLRAKIGNQSYASLLVDELDGHSIELMRSLSLINNYDFTQQCLAKDKESLIRFAKTLEEIRPSKRDSGSIQYSATKLAHRWNMQVGDLSSFELPDITVETSLPPEYIAGIFDACEGFSFRVVRDPTFDLNYSIHPVIHLNRASLHPVTVSAIKTTLADHGIQFRENSETDIYTLNIMLHGQDRVADFFQAFADYVNISVPDIEVFFQEIRPRFEQGLHRTKQGFYDLLYIGEEQLDVFTRERKYDLSHFATEWGDEIDTYGV
jgi:hypothetical protein